MPRSTPSFCLAASRVSNGGIFACFHPPAKRQTSGELETLPWRWTPQRLWRRHVPGFGSCSCRWSLQVSRGRIVIGRHGQHHGYFGAPNTGRYETLLRELNENDDSVRSVRNILRVEMQQFDIVCAKVGLSIEQANTNIRQCISARERMAITLRVLAYESSPTSPR